MALRVRLDTAYFTKNWKHYSKIIFKCVNNTVWPFFFFFNKVVVGSVNSTWTVHKQCVNSDEQCFLCSKSRKQVNQKKKEKNAIAKCRIQTLTKLKNSLFYYSAYFYYYSWVLLYFLILFIGLTVLFQLIFTFIYSTFSKKLLISTK